MTPLTIALCFALLVALLSFIDTTRPSSRRRTDRRVHVRRTHGAAFADESHADEGDGS